MMMQEWQWKDAVLAELGRHGIHTVWRLQLEAMFENRQTVDEAVKNFLAAKAAGESIGPETVDDLWWLRDDYDDSQDPSPEEAIRRLKQWIDENKLGWSQIR